LSRSNKTIFSRLERREIPIDAHNDPARCVAMTAAANAIDLLHREIANPDTQWSLGTFGAIAEFSRDCGEPVLLIRCAARLARKFRSSGPRRRRPGRSRSSRRLNRREDDRFPAGYPPKDTNFIDPMRGKTGWTKVAAR
jgi:hypothetical protein